MKGKEQSHLGREDIRIVKKLGVNDGWREEGTTAFASPFSKFSIMQQVCEVQFPSKSDVNLPGEMSTDK